MHRSNHGSRGRPDRNGSGAGENVIAQVKQGASGMVERVRDGARAAADSIKNTASDMTNAVIDTVLEEAEQLYEKQKDRAVSRVSSIGKIARQTAHALHAVKADKFADYIDDASHRVDEAGDYLEERTLTEMLQDAGEVVRRNRGITMGTLFVAGFALARFLKSSESGDESDEESDESGADEESEAETSGAGRGQSGKRNGRENGGQGRQRRGR